MATSLNESVNPFKVLNVPKNFTLEQLRDQYKRIAISVHPDKGGSNELFQLVTQCYKTLLNYFREREEEKTFLDLKNEFHKFNLDNKGAQNIHMQAHQAQPTSPPPSSAVAAPAPKSSKRSSKTAAPATPAAAPSKKAGHVAEEKWIDRFNHVFEEHRVEEAHDAGYGSVMHASTGKREDVEVPKTIKRFTAKNFNKAFDKQEIGQANREIMVYKAPDALPSAKNVHYSELGLDKVDDFSGANDSSSKLHYMDYMKAHSTSKLIDPRLVKAREEYRSVDHLKAARAGPVQMTEEDMAMHAEAMHKQKEIERHREYMQRQMDERAFKQFDAAHKLMLGHR